MMKYKKQLNISGKMQLLGQKEGQLTAER